MRTLSTSADLEAAVADALVGGSVLCVFLFLIHIFLCLNRKLPPNQVTKIIFDIFKNCVTIE